MLIIKTLLLIEANSIPKPISSFSQRHFLFFVDHRNQLRFDPPVLIDSLFITMTRKNPWDFALETIRWHPWSFRSGLLLLKHIIEDAVGVEDWLSWLVSAKMKQVVVSRASRGRYSWCGIPMMRLSFFHKGLFLNSRDPPIKATKNGFFTLRDNVASGVTFLDKLMIMLFQKLSKTVLRSFDLLVPPWSTRSNTAIKSRSLSQWYFGLFMDSSWCYDCWDFGELTLASEHF